MRFDLMITVLDIMNMTPGNVGDGFCANTANIWQIVGYVLLVLKIVIPILIILYGMIDLGRAVVAAKDDEIKKSTKQLAFRAVAGIAIFFVPTIIGLLVNMLSIFADARDDFQVCRACITSPNNSECDGYASEVENY